ncbi:MAG TPA: DUF3556 domain-containing protein [Aeromicrobium sp.]|nr:DUF3556 domain-containing protein [Aeromicrobium sp.]HKY56732.1 DUF3556 domain-containing protein [Aeromicrobium sp.]
MGFISPTPQPVKPAEFLQLPFLERIRILSQHWAVDGFGTPRMLHVVYILKMFGLYFGAGIGIAAATSGHVELMDPTTWFDNIFTYQKLALWLMFIEVFGFGGTFGPLCGHFVPMLGNVRYWLRPGTLRMAPWGNRVPLTGGDERTIADVLLLLAVFASLGYALILPAEPVLNLPAGTPTQELVPPAAFIPILIAMPLMGLRDKVIFLAGRSEQYLPIMLFSATLGALVMRDGAQPADFVNLIVGFKIVICIIWIGAGVSKLGEHFINVVPPMVSNQPGMPTFVKKLHYRNVPNDLRPSKLAWFMAHVGGTTIEIGIPLVLLFTTSTEVAIAGAIAMVIFHLFIISTFPLAVPLEWNVFFGFAALVLWGGLGFGLDASVYNIWNFSEPLLLIPMFALGLIFPIWGNLRPRQISFLPSMRQYSGNWASASWAMRPGIEDRIGELPLVESQVSQLQRMKPTPYDADDAEMTMQKLLAWRSLHSQGRGLYSVLIEHLPDIESRTIRDAEFVCNTILGWNFGDGHLHDERLIAAIQKRLNLQPGDLVVAFCESQPTPWRKHVPQQYRVIDAALGVVERGSWNVTECVNEQPWLPNGPVPLDVSWTAPGFRRRETLAVLSAQPAD